LVPAAIRRTIAPDPQDLFAGTDAEKGMSYMRSQFPPAFFDDPLSDKTAAVVEVPASKAILPQLFEAAGRPMEKSDFFLIAQNMKPEEIHPEVVRVLDAVAALLPGDDVGDAGPANPTDREINYVP
jgi:hypothetical protein